MHTDTDQQPTNTIEQGATIDTIEQGPAFDRETDFYPVRTTQV